MVFPILQHDWLQSSRKHYCLQPVQHPLHIQALDGVSIRVGSITQHWTAPNSSQHSSTWNHPLVNYRQIQVSHRPWLSLDAKAKPSHFLDRKRDCQLSSQCLQSWLHVFTVFIASTSMTSTEVTAHVSIPLDYQEYRSLFSKVKASGLPPLSTTALCLQHWEHACPRIANCIDYCGLSPKLIWECTWRWN